MCLIDSCYINTFNLYVCLTCTLIDRNPLAYGLLKNQKVKAGNIPSQTATQRLLLTSFVRRNLRFNDIIMLSITLCVETFKRSV